MAGCNGGTCANLSEKARIGSACWYRLAEPGQYNSDLSRWRGGRLLAWSTDYQELESGLATLPVGVIEDDKTGVCHSVYVGQICFATVPPQ